MESRKIKFLLIEITSKILLKKDEKTGKDLVDVILDKAGQKGTGKWTSIEALHLGVAAPTIAESVFARCLSAIKKKEWSFVDIYKASSTVARFAKRGIRRSGKCGIR